MKMAKLVVCLGTVAMAWASASKSYDVTLNNPAQVSGTELKAGTYSVVLAGDKAMIPFRKSIGGGAGHGAGRRQKVLRDLGALHRGRWQVSHQGNPAVRHQDHVGF